jgi:hypothetical protein
LQILLWQQRDEQQQQRLLARQKDDGRGLAVKKWPRKKILGAT